MSVELVEDLAYARPEKMPEVLRGHKALILALVDYNIGYLGVAAAPLQDDPEVLRAAIRRSGQALRYGSLALRGRRDLVLEAVRQDGLALAHASKLLRADSEVVGAAVATSQGRALQFAAESLKGDRRFVIRALACCPRALKFAAPQLLRDRGVVLAAVREDYSTLALAAAFHGDAEVVLAAVDAAPSEDSRRAAFRCATRELRGDQRFMLAVMRRVPAAVRGAASQLLHDEDFMRAALAVHPLAFLLASVPIRNDPAFMLAALRHLATAFGPGSAWPPDARDALGRELEGELPIVPLVSPVLRDERTMAESAIEQGVVAVYQAAPILFRDRAFIIAAMAIQPLVFHFATEDLRRDWEVVLRAFACDAYEPTYLAPYLCQDPIFIREALSVQPLALSHAPETMLEDREVVLAAVRRRSEALRWASETLRGDRTIVLAAIGCEQAERRRVEEGTPGSEPWMRLAKPDARAGGPLQWAMPELQGNREVVMEAVAVNGCALRHSLNSMRGDVEVVLAALAVDPSALRYAYRDLRATADVVLAAVTRQGAALRFAMEPLGNDRTVVLAAVRQDGAALAHASEVLREDREVVLEAVRQTGKALQWAGQQFLRDRDVVLAAVGNDAFALEFADPQLQAADDPEMVRTAVEAFTRRRAGHAALRGAPEASRSLLRLLRGDLVREMQAWATEYFKDRHVADFEEVHARFVGCPVVADDVRLQEFPHLGWCFRQQLAEAGDLGDST